jgi:hypothetical protein
MERGTAKKSVSKTRPCVGVRRLKAKMTNAQGVERCTAEELGVHGV